VCWHTGRTSGWEAADQGSFTAKQGLKLFLGPVGVFSLVNNT
jgi:hypothetical protein